MSSKYLTKYPLSGLSYAWTECERVSLWASLNLSQGWGFGTSYVLASTVPGLWVISVFIAWGHLWPKGQLSFRQRTLSEGSHGPAWVPVITQCTWGTKHTSKILNMGTRRVSVSEPGGTLPATLLVLWMQEVDTMLTSRLHPRYTRSGTRKLCLWIVLVGDSQTACLIRNWVWLAYQRGCVLIQTGRFGWLAIDWDKVWQYPWRDPGMGCLAGECSLLVPVLSTFFMGW